MGTFTYISYSVSVITFLKLDFKQACFVYGVKIFKYLLLKDWIFDGIFYIILQIFNKWILSICIFFYTAALAKFCILLHMYIFFCSPFAYLDPLHYNMNNLFVQLVKDSLNEYAYAAELAGLSYCLRNTKIGIYVSVLFL